MLALADLGGELRLNAVILGLLPLPVGAIRMDILQRLFANAGHAANDLRVLNKPPQSLLGWIPWFLKLLATMFFSFYCSFVQSFQLQSSKVSDISRHWIALHCIMHFENGTTASLLFVDRMIGILMK